VTEASARYIIMEYVDGEPIDSYLVQFPEQISSVFRQTIAAFCHLEECGILHRDLRFQNVLVSKEGTVKVIDLGFGKEVRENEDYKKSITLNWAFTPPLEFAQNKYDFRSEVYFVGKPFEKDYRGQWHRRTEDCKHREINVRGESEQKDAKVYCGAGVSG